MSEPETGEKLYTQRELDDRLADLQRQLAAKDAEIAKLKRNLVASVRAALEATK